MFWSFVIVCAVAALALSGWVLAELELRDAHHELDRMQFDLDMALGWRETQTVDVPVRSTLHVIDGGNS